MSTVLDDIVTTRLWRHGKFVTDAVPIEAISDHLCAEGDLIWVGLQSPSPAMLERMGAELGLDPQSIEDSSTTSTPQGPKYDTYTFLTVYAASMTEIPNPQTDSRLRLTKISAFVFPKGLVTVHYDREFSFEPVVARWKENGELMKYGKSALVHGLLDIVVDGYFEVAQQIDDEVELLEDDLLEDRSISSNLQLKVYRLRKDLVRMRRAVLPMREVISTVLRHRREMFSHRELDTWFDDLYDHALRAAEWTDSLRDLVASIFETNMALQDTKLNAVMRQLAAWAAIIAVPTAITGWFGQNVPYFGYEQGWGVWFSLALIVVISLTLYLAFKKRRWI